MEETKANTFFFFHFNFHPFIAAFLLIDIYGFAQAAPKSDAANFISGPLNLTMTQGWNLRHQAAPPLAPARKLPSPEGWFSRQPRRSPTAPAWLRQR